MRSLLLSRSIQSPNVAKAGCPLLQTTTQLHDAGGDDDGGDRGDGDDDNDAIVDVDDDDVDIDVDDADVDDVVADGDGGDDDDSGGVCPAVPHRLLALQALFSNVLHLRRPELPQKDPSLG